MIIKNKLPQAKNKERGDIIQAVLTIAVFAILAIFAVNALGDAITNKIDAVNEKTGQGVNSKTCKANTKEIADNLIQYVENYRVNNPNRELEEIIISPDNSFDSQQYETLLSDKKFSELVDSSNCLVLKYEPDNGNQFVIKKGTAQGDAQKITKNNVLWEVVHSSK